MQELEGKKILFFSAPFFGYSTEICSAMEHMGASVDYFDERPANTFFVKAMIRMRPELLNNYIKKYYAGIIEKTKDVNYDYIFFIKAEAVTIALLQKFKELHPHAKMVLYLYDSIENNPNVMTKLSLFEDILSFDRNDSDRYHFRFRPLFYTLEYPKILNNNQNKDIDVLFVGTVHSDRYNYVKQIETQVIKMGRKIYYYLFFPSQIMYYKMKCINSALRNTHKSEFKFHSISQTEIIKLLKRSRCVIDIQHPKQIGLTMRTIEMLGARLKLITTNADIVNYDFYSPNNILVVDRKSPIIPADFIDNPYVDVSKEIYEKYSISSWLLEILEPYK